MDKGKALGVPPFTLLSLAVIKPPAMWLKRKQFLLTISLNNNHYNVSGWFLNIQHHKNDLKIHVRPYGFYNSNTPRFSNGEEKHNYLFLTYCFNQQ
jgi:hypothetical protein